MRLLPTLLLTLGACGPPLSEQEAATGLTSASSELASAFATGFAGAQDFDFRATEACSSGGTVTVDSGWSLLGLFAQVRADFDACSDGRVTTTGSADVDLDIEVDLDPPSVVGLAALTGDLDFTDDDFAGPCELDASGTVDLSVAFTATTDVSGALCGHPAEDLAEEFVDPILEMISNAFEDAVVELLGG